MATQHQERRELVFKRRKGAGEVLQTKMIHTLPTATSPISVASRRAPYLTCWPQANSPAFREHQELDEHASPSFLLSLRSSLPALFP